MVRCLWWRKQSFLWILASRSVGHSVDSKPYSRRLLRGLCILWELQAKEIQVQEPLPDKQQLTLLSLQISNEPYNNQAFQLFQFQLRFKGSVMYQTLLFNIYN